MTVDAGTEVDPLFDVFNDEEERLAAMIRGEGQKAIDLKAVGAAIAAGFILYRMYMQRRLREEAAAAARPLTPHTLYELNSKIFTTGWARIAWTLLPAITQGYYLGLQDVSQGNYSRGWIQNAAEDYATQLAEHLHDTSSEALVQGVQAQINRRVTQRRVIDNVIEAFGAPPRTMNALVNVWSAEPERMLSAGEGRNTLKDRADSIVARAIKERAQNIGQTESFAVKNNAKSIVWLYLQQEGQLPKDATKMWITAKDERVCPTCGPLHQMQVPLDAKFPTALGEVWAPSLHPRCRCDIVLRGAVQVFDSGEYLEESEPRELELAKSAWGVVEKAASGDLFDRDSHGRFAAQESRKPKPKLKPVAYKEPETFAVTQAEPEDVATLAQIFERYGATFQERLASERFGGGEKFGEKFVASEKFGGTKITESVSEKMGEKLKGERLGGERLRKTRLKGTAFPSSEKLDQQKPRPDLEENDTWKPIKEKSFGLFFHEGQTDGDHSIMLADNDTYFYPRSDEGSQLHDTIADYWEEELFNELPWRFSQLPDFQPDEDSEEDSHYFATASMADGTGGKYLLNYEQYNDIVLDAVAGADRHDSYRMELPYMTRDGRMEQREITTLDAARLLDLTSEIEYLTPTVGVANWKSVEAEEYNDGTYTNPGKWRITGVYKDNTKSWMGRDNPMPYKIVFIEPDDLFPD